MGVKGGSAPGRWTQTRCLTADACSVGPEGIEPSTRGLKVPAGPRGDPRWQSALRLWPAVLVLVEIGSSWLLSNVLRTICGLSSRLVSTGKDRVPSAHERPAGRPPPEARHPRTQEVGLSRKAHFMRPCRAALGAGLRRRLPRRLRRGRLCRGPACDRGSSSWSSRAAVSRCGARRQTSDRYAPDGVDVGAGGGSGR